MEWIATAAFGLEGVVARELRALGVPDVRAGNGGARFAAPPADAFRANLWLRCADRVLLHCGSFEAATFDQLFEGVRALPWADWIPRDGAFPVRGKCVRAQLMSVSDCQAITKKAIVEKLKARYKTAWFPETGEAYAVEVSVRGAQVAITMDASGVALNRRGYRTWNGEAPLRETLAAALVALSPWRPGRPLHDPTCGTGTLLVEAAMRAADRAPGLTRAFACERWGFVDRSAFASIRAEAEARFRPGAVEGISGSDIDPGALSLAARHAEQAGLGKRIPFTRCDAAELRVAGERGVFLCNPPYGERLGDRAAAEELYRALARLLGRHPGWSLGALSAHPGFERCLGRRAGRKRRLYNGRLECEWMTFLPGAHP
ncbi:MAG: class I SAM-dependent RNA methyltransferase [Clostridia bacterium]|nr:class I SAM-dependent RNA methyltransferase [Clostridia bacterium]